MGHEPCPRCGSSDNLGRYLDGSGYCFGCGYREQPTKLAFHHISKSKAIDKSSRTNSILTLPQDISVEISIEGLKWLAKYNISSKEIADYGIRWSDSGGGIVFTCFDSSGVCVGYQIRHFRNKERKYTTRGKAVQMSMSMLRNRDVSLPLVFVEDVLSAIKVSRIAPCVPLLGSNIPLELLRWGSESFKSFKIWLDPDKRQSTVKQVLNARQKGFECSAVFAGGDPKDLTTEEIKEKLSLDRKD